MSPAAAGPGPGAWALLLGVWVGAAALSGLLLALLARKIHPALSFRRLWIFYSGLTAFLVAVVFLVGVF